MSESLIRLAGSYITWETHIGSHYCEAATGEGPCEVGNEVLRRLHTAIAALTEDERREALQVVREWDWQPEAPYGSW